MLGADILAPAIDDLRLGCLHRTCAAARAAAPLEVPTGPISGLEVYLSAVAALEVIGQGCHEAAQRGWLTDLPDSDTPADLALLATLATRLEAAARAGSDTDRPAAVLAWGACRWLLALTDDTPGEGEVPGTAHFQAALDEAGDLARPILAHLPLAARAALAVGVGERVDDVLDALAALLAAPAHAVTPDALTAARDLIGPALVDEARGEDRPVVAMLAGVDPATISAWIPPEGAGADWEPRVVENAFGAACVS